MRIDATNAMVAAGVLLIVGTGSWLVVGSALVWAVWQLVAFYALLGVVAATLYGVLFLAVGRDDGDSPRDRVIGN